MDEGRQLSLFSHEEIPDGVWGWETSTKVQERLIARGYGCGSCGADGYFGNDSVRALQRCLNDGKLR